MNAKLAQNVVELGQFLIRDRETDTLASAIGYSDCCLASNCIRAFSDYERAITEEPVRLIVIYHANARERFLQLARSEAKRRAQCPFLFGALLATIP